MGKLMKENRQSMSLRMKSGIIHLLTLATLLVMGGGLLSPHLSEAAVVKVQTVSGGNNNTTSVALPALSAAPANGNTMIAVIATRGTTANRVLSITQTGATWSRVTQATNAGGTTTEIWYAPNVAGAGTGITINLAAATYAAAVVSEYNGLLAASADVSANTTGSSAAASTGTTTATTAVDELWIGGIGLVNSGYTLSSITNTFTEVANAVSTGASATNNARVYALQRVVNTTGAATTGGTVSTSSQWSGAIATFKMTVVLTCTACHGGTGSFTDGTARNNPAGTFPGTHNGHVVGSSVACSSCHVAPGASEFNHANGKITMAAGLTYGTKGTEWNVTNSPSAFQSCSGTTCHGTSSPAWGNNTADASCVKCHGVSGTTPAQYTADTKTAAPGYNGGRDTGGATVATDAQVGAHAAHLTGSSNYSNPIACTECHANVNPSNSSFPGHMNGAPSVDFGPVASTTPASYTAPNCTTYCHSGAVAWNNTALLDGTIANDCSKCHGFPPATNHDGITTIDQCNGCHDHVNTSGVFTDKTKHVNGIKDGGCSGCHGWPPATNAHTVHIDTIKAEKSLSSLPAGFVDNVVCGTCHNVSAANKHAGTVGNDGSSRNIYLPSPSALQASYQFGASPVSYDKGATETCSNISCHLGSSPAWGTPPTSTCQACHGYPPVTAVGDPDNKHMSGATPVNHVGTGGSVNTKTTFVSAHGGCQICHGTQDSGSGTHSPAANYNVATQHFTGSINMNGPTGTGTGYDAATGGCNAACHANDATHRMTTTGKTPVYGNYGTGGDCVSCHTIAQPSPIAQGLNAAVTQRAAVVGEFGLAWGHKKSGRGAVTVADCIVCHLEGEYATQAASATKHKNGYVDLRDPDGTGEAAITNNSGGAFSFVKYAISYAAGSRTTTLGNTIPEVVTVKFCLKCHDSNGATNTSARTPGGTAAMPFGGIALGANYIANNNAIGTQGLIDVATQVASTNSSRHPIGAPSLRAYPYSNRLLAPYNNIGTTRNSNTQTINTASPRVKANSVILVCDDCHTTGTSLLDRTITAHGAATSLRGTFFVSAPTLCLTCHIAGSNGAYNNTATTSPGGSHGAGSAFGPGTTRPAGALNYCNYCHFSNPNTYAAASRPRFAQDIHGFNTMYGTSAGWTTGSANGMRPIAFMRNSSWPSGFSPRPYTATTGGPGQFNLAAGNSQCGGSFAFAGGNSGISCSSNGHTTYTPGGSY